MKTRMLLCTLLALASCQQESVNEPTSDGPRRFSPRLVAVPTAERVLVQVATQPFSTNGSTPIVAQGEATWSAGGVEIHDLPSGDLWFRVSGLDANRSPLWSSTGTVPTGNSKSQVDIGGNSGVPVTAAPEISIAANASGDRLSLSCAATTGFHPAWNQGSSAPTAGGTFQQTPNAITEVDLPASSMITARCTDGFTWGKANSWTWDPTPTVPEPDLSTAGTELGVVTINTPAPGQTGMVSFSTNSNRTDIPNLQYAVKVGGAAAFQRFSAGYSFQVGSFTKVEAYLVGWSAVSHRWLKGPLQTAKAGTPELKGAGTTFSPPGIQGPSQQGGMVSFTLPTTGGSYQAFRLAVWDSKSQATTLQEPTYSFAVNEPMTIKAYAIAWDPLQGDWFYGKESSLTVPVQSSLNPVASGPADELAQPSVNIPATGSGMVSFSVPATFPSDLGPVKIVVKNSSNTWDWYDISYQMPVSPGTTFNVYLIAWSPTEKRWKQGTLLSKTVALANPTTPPALYASGTAFMPPEISAQGAFPLQASFLNPTDLPAAFTPRQIAYRTAALGTMPSGEFTYLSEGSTLPISAQTQIEACVVAWDPTNATWRVGRSKTIQVTGGLPVGEPNFNLGGGSDLEIPQMTPPAALPGYLQIYAPATMPSDLVEAKIAYQTSGSAGWMTIKPGDKIWIQSPIQVTAFVAAWSNNLQRWLYGRPKSLYVDPTQTTLAPPVFTDASNGTIAGVFEAPGTNFSLNATATTGSVYYTVDGSTPSPGAGTTKIWMAANQLAIPTGVDSVLVRAVAYDGSRVSAETHLVAHLPRWKLLDKRDLGCLVAGPDGRVFACGDWTGPKVMMDTGWMDLVTNWSLPTAQIVYVNDSELVAGVEGEVWKIRKFSDAVERLDTVDLGWVYSLARHGGALWASTDSGTVIYYNDAWRHMATPHEPDGTGPMWSDGSYLWQGSGDVVGKFGWDQTLLSNDWVDWGTKASNIRAFQADSFSTIRDAFLVATDEAVYQWSTSIPGSPGRSIYDPTVQGIEGLAWGPGNRLYMAFRNSNGEGGVRRSPGWLSGWNPVAVGWPGASEGTPFGALGVGIHKSGDGSHRVVATTPRGTYTVRLVVF